MAVSTKLRSLNAFPEWYNSSKWVGVRAFVKSIQEHKTPVYPRNMTDEDVKKRFRQKFHRDYEVENNRLYYRPKDADGNYRLNLEVIQPSANKKYDVLQAIYDDDTQGGWGETLFYWKVAQSYLGFTREFTTDFLKHHESFQLSRNYSKKVNHPIQTKVPNQKWFVDCVYLLGYSFDPNAEGKEELMNVYGHNVEYQHRKLDDELIGLVSYRYLLMCVDGYSRFCWVEPMLSHSAEETTTAFKKILRDSQTIPAIVVTDNGKEFRGEFEQLLRDNEIFHLETTTYSPWSNGIAERKNREIRNKIKQGFLRHNNGEGDLEWVQHLQKYVYNLNHSRSGKHNITPSIIWTRGFQRPSHRFLPPDWGDDDKIEDTSTLRKIKDKYTVDRIRQARDAVNRRPTNVFFLNDLVRIAAEVHFSESRARNKNGMMKKYNVINWTPQIFKIVEIRGRRPEPNQQLQDLGVKSWSIREQSYRLKNLETNDVINKWYYGSELQLVPDNTEFTQISNPRSGELNRLTPYT